MGQGLIGDSTVKEHPAQIETIKRKIKHMIHIEYKWCEWLIKFIQDFGDYFKIIQETSVALETVESLKKLYLNVFYVRKWASAWLRLFCFHLRTKRSSTIDDVIRVCFTDMSNESKFLIDTNLNEFMNECLVRKFSDNNVREDSEENNQLFT